MRAYRRIAWATLAASLAPVHHALCEKPAQLSTSEKQTITSAIAVAQTVDSRHLGTAVCVSQDGLTIVRNVIDLRAPLRVVAGDRISLTFADGRTANAVVAGWSNAWGVAFARIDGDREWPHVSINRLEAPVLGEACFAAEFQPTTQALVFNAGHRLARRKELVQRNESG
jgi:hypothetical protein